MIRLQVIVRAFIFFAVLMTMLIGSCVHEPFVEPPTQPNDPKNNAECDPDTAYFTKDVMPIIQANCVNGCHDEVTANKGVVLTDYSRIMATADVRPGNPDGSDLYDVLVDPDAEERMPYGQPPLSAENIAIIRKWIAQGALNNTCDFDTLDEVCGGPGMSYQDHVVPILQANGCIGCHASGSVILNTYEGVATVANNGRLVGAVTHADGYQPMPQGGNKLDSCSIATIVDWVEQGAMNN